MSPADILFGWPSTDIGKSLTFMSMKIMATNVQCGVFDYDMSADIAGASGGASTTGFLLPLLRAGLLRQR